MKKIKGSFADELKRAARAGKGGDPVFRNANGWRFGLSFGPTKGVARETFDRFFTEEMWTRFGHKPGTRPTWEEVKDTERTGAAIGFFDSEWILSASLQPRGRSSTVKDWEYLGHMTVALGAPDGALRTPFETTDPNAVHYWIWFDVESRDAN